MPFGRLDRWNREADSLARLIQEHQSDCLWVQYSGYGFAYQGLPWYLLRALRRLRGRVPIVVYFHQRHCSIRQLGWKGILISPLQRRIGKSIAACADAAITSCAFFRELIGREYNIPRNKFHMLPIGSNIPVPAATRQQRERLRTNFGWKPDTTVAVVFGSPGSQRDALRRNQQALIEAVHGKLIHNIVCVGGAPGPPPRGLIEACDASLRPHLTVLGHQDESRIGELLIAADVGLTFYPPEKFGKSGVMMAYAMAGLPALVPEDLAQQRSNGDAGSLVRRQTMRSLAGLQFDESLRRAEQRRAAATVGWPALATQALTILDTIVSPPEK
jgi:hypothetical protein